MCISRVGRVLSVQGNLATVKFFDGRTSDSVEVSMLKVRKGAFIEVFGNLALKELTGIEARKRFAAWNELGRLLSADLVVDAERLSEKTRMV